MPVSLYTIDSAIDPVAHQVALRCHRCQRAMTVAYRPEVPSAKAYWECPYPDCGAANYSDVGGPVTDVLVGWSLAARRELER